MGAIDYKSFGLEPVEEIAKEQLPNIDYKSFGLEPINKQSSSLQNDLLSFSGKTPTPIGLLPTNALNKASNAGSMVLKDVWSMLKSLPLSAVKAIGEIPNDVSYLKNNIPQSASLIMNNPEKAARYAGAGGLELLGGASRIPQNLINYLSKIGLISPEIASQFVQSYTPEETKQISESFVGKPEPGGELIKKTIEASPYLYGGAKVLSAFNPLKLSKGAIAQDILSKETIQKSLHNKEYNKIWKQAENEGFNKVHYDPSKIDIDSIKKYTPEKYYGALENFLNEPVLKNAQKAQSDLGKLIREMSRKVSLTSEEKNTLNSAIKARDHIKEKMFINESGELNTPLKNKYDRITSSYEKNVIPYTTNKAIQQYKRGELTKEDLIRNLSQGKFSAQKGAQHPELQRRKQAATLLNALGIGGTTGATFAGTQALIDKLLNKEPRGR